MARLELLLLFVLPTCLAGSALLVNVKEQVHNQLGVSSGADPAMAVQQAYVAQNKQLRAYYESLAATLRSHAPDLLARLQAPEPVEHGYGILPRIVTGSPALQTARSRSAAYSWPWTKRLIDEQVRKIADCERKLHDGGSRPVQARRRVFEELARTYSGLRAGQHLIDAHIEYNRLWQAAIAANRAAYDRQTSLHNVAVERQALRDALTAGRRQAYAGFSALDKSLKKREQLLKRDIEAAIAQIDKPAFIRMEQQVEPHLWTVVLPIYSDITDSEFLHVLKTEVEDIWRVRDGQIEFRVELALSQVSDEQLYGLEPPPRLGSKIDLEGHLGRFPPDGAILTTGAATTHVYGRALILGPHPLQARVVAHEIGHLLGFKDGYFRGYRELRRNGFEVLEVVAAPDDIMGAPETGTVLRRHFEQLLSQPKHKSTESKRL